MTKAIGFMSETAIVGSLAKLGFRGHRGGLYVIAHGGVTAQTEARDHGF
jgi:hypothetical protein